MVTQTAPAKTASFAIPLAFLCVYIFWGSTYVAIDIGVRLIPALLLAGVRFLIAGTILLSFCAGKGLRVRWDRGTMLRLGILGVLMLSGGNVGLVWSESYIASGLAALIIAIVPLYVAVLEWLLPGGERLRARGIVGLLLGLVALAELLWPSMRHGLRGDRLQMLASVIVLLGALSWAVGSVVSRRMRLPVPPLVAAGWEMMAAGLMNVILGSLAGNWRQAHWTPAAAGAIAYLVTFGSLVAFTSYIWLLEHVPVAKVATYAYVNPVVAVILGALILGERLSPSEYIGMVLVVIAVALVTSSQTSSSRSAAESTPAAVNAEV